MRLNRANKNKSSNMNSENAAHTIYFAPGGRTLHSIRAAEAHSCEHRRVFRIRLLRFASNGSVHTREEACDSQWEGATQTAINALEPSSGRIADPRE